MSRRPSAPHDGLRAVVVTALRDWRRDLALSFAGAALMVAAAPPIGCWAAGLVAWVPIAIVASGGRPRRAAAAGWLQGTVAQAAVLASLPDALRRAGGASPVASALMAAILWTFEGGRVGVVGAAAALGVRNGWSLLASLPAALVAAEWLYPMLFPWSTGLLLHGAPVLLQGAELGGPAVLSSWTGFVGASLALAYVTRARRCSLLRYAVLVPGVTLAIVSLYGTVRMREIARLVAESPEVRVGLVQGDFEDARHETTDPVAAYRAASLALTRREALDLLVWPETAVPFPVSSEALPSFLSSRIFRGASGPPGPRLDVPLLTGIVLARKPPESPAHVRPIEADGTWRAPEPALFNSAVLATPDGRVRGVYDKRELMAFGEYLPYEGRFPWLRAALPGAGRFSRGTSAAPLALDGRRVLVLICFEDILGDSVRRAVAEGDPELLVNLTSDAWFGKSRVPALHLALARLRAVEHRRFLVHATNTGISAVVDPAGRIVASLPPRRAASGIASARWLDGRTPYEWIGATPCLAASAALAVFASRRRRARRAWPSRSR